MSHSHELFADFFQRQAGTAHDAANPIHLRASTLLLKGVASACGDLDHEQARLLEIQQKLPMVIGEKSQPNQLDMWVDRSLGGNALSSFLAELPGEKLQRAVGDSAFSERFRLQPQPLVGAVLEALNENPRDLKRLTIVNCIVGDRPLYYGLRDQVRRALGSVDLVQHYKTSPSECEQLIIFRSQLAASSEAQDLVDQVWQECLSLCDYIWRTGLGGEEVSMRQKQLALAVADAAIRFSGLSTDRKQGVHSLVHRLTDVVKRCPALAKHLYSVFDEAFRYLPCEDLAGVPHLLSVFRALA